MGMAPLCFNFPYIKPHTLWTWLFGYKERTYDIPDTLRGQYENMVYYVLRLMVSRGFFSTIQISERGELSAPLSPEAVQGSCPYATILTFNMRRLPDEEAVAELLAHIQDTDRTRGVTDYIALSTVLSTLYPESLLNMVINKTYRGLASIDNGFEEGAFEDLHVEYPYLWVVIFMNQLAIRFSEPRVVM